MKVTGSKCFDSSAWLAYYFGESKEVKSIIEGEFSIITSALSLFEIKKKLITLKKDFEEFLEFIKQRSSIIVTDINIAEKSAEISVDKQLGAIDSLIYTTSILNESELITCDNDFRGLEKVKLI